MRAAFGAGEGPGLNGGAGAGGGVGSIPMLNGRIYYEAAGLQKRPPLNKCTEEQFLADLIAFMKARKPSDKVDASSFPETGEGEYSVVS